MNKTSVIAIFLLLFCLQCSENQERKNAKPSWYPIREDTIEGIKTIINPDYTNSSIIAANNCDISGFTLTGTGMNYKDYTFSSGVHALDCDSTLVIRGNIFDSNAVFVV